MKITKNFLLVITVSGSELGEKRRKLGKKGVRQGKVGKCYLRPQQCCPAETNDCYGCEEPQLLLGSFFCSNRIFQKMSEFLDFVVFENYFRS